MSLYDISKGQGDKPQIIFAAVDEKYDESVFDNGVHFFPDEQSLLRFKFNKKNVVYLNNVPDSDCKKCTGTGKLDTRLKNADVTVRQISNKIKNRIVGDSEDKFGVEFEKLVDDLIELLSLTEDYRDPLNKLLAEILEDLTFDNQLSVSDRLAEIIKEDCTVREPIWCKCFTDNLQKEIQRTLSQQKFGIN